LQKINCLVFFVLICSVILPINHAESAIPTFDATIPMYDYTVPTNNDSLQIGFSIEAYADKPLINEETRFLIGFFNAGEKSFHNDVTWSALILKNGTEIKKINNEPVKNGMDWFSVMFQESGNYQIQINVDNLPSSPNFSDTVSLDFKVVESSDEQVCDLELILIGGECVSKDTLQNQTPIKSEKLNITQDTNNEEDCIYNYLPVELQYNIENGNVESICYNKESVSLLIEVTSKLGASKITVHLPKTMIFSVDQECNSAGEIMILLNEEEIDSSILTISETSSERIATLILPEGMHFIEFIGTYTLGSPNPLDICGSIHGYDTQYLPPLKQWRFIDPTEVRCNAGMELIFKQNGNDPACIKTTHIEKFLEREKNIWGKEFQCSPCE